MTKQRLKSSGNSPVSTSLATAEFYLSTTLRLSMASHIMNSTAIRFAAKIAYGFIVWLLIKGLQIEKPSSDALKLNSQLLAL